MNFEKIKKFIFHHKHSIALILILILAAFLRFYDYPQRWGLAADQARDVLVARQAIVLHSVPLIGPFSASGPFVFGPYWYYFLMIPVGLFPSFVLAPWIFETFLYVLVVGLMYLIGKEIKDKNFGLIAAFLTAISPSQIILSTNLIQSALVGLLAFPILYIFILYLKKKTIFLIWFLALLISLAINIHFEAVPLFLILPVAIVFGNKSWKHIILLIIGFLIPFLPLLIFNFQSHFYESSNIFTLHIKDGSNFLINSTRRALNYLKVILPNSWGRAVGGYVQYGYVLFPFIFMLSLYSLLKRKLNVLIGITILAYILTTLILFLYPGKIFINYLSFRYPFILILATWFCIELYNIKKFLGVFLLGIIILGNLIFISNTIYTSTNNSADIGYYFLNYIEKTDPNERFSLYSYKDSNKEYSLPLSLILSVNNLELDNGDKIGIGYFGAPIRHQLIYTGPLLKGVPGLNLYNLGNKSDKQLELEGFASINQSSIYKSVEEWYK